MPCLPYHSSSMNRERKKERKKEKKIEQNKLTWRSLKQNQKPQRPPQSSLDCVCHPLPVSKFTRQWVYHTFHPLNKGWYSLPALESKTVPPWSLAFPILLFFLSPKAALSSTLSSLFKSQDSLQTRTRPTPTPSWIAEVQQQRLRAGELACPQGRGALPEGARWGYIWWAIGCRGVGRPPPPPPPPPARAAAAAARLFSCCWWRCRWVWEWVWAWVWACMAAAAAALGLLVRLAICSRARASALLGGSSPSRSACWRSADSRSTALA